MLCILEYSKDQEITCTEILPYWHLVTRFAMHGRIRSSIEPPTHIFIIVVPPLPVSAVVSAPVIPVLSWPRTPENILHCVEGYA